MTDPCLLQLPPEILELFVLNVVGLSNLLALGLTSRTLARIVFPRHIQYHTVCASLRHVHTWQHLIHNRSCARYVRCLEVVKDSVLGSSLSGPNRFQLDDTLDYAEYSPGRGEASELDYDLWREQILALALKGMSNLRSFAWLRSRPPIISGVGDIWSTLHHKEYLVDVRLHGAAPARRVSVCQSEQGKRAVRPLPVCPILTTFFGLTKFEFVCNPTRPDVRLSLLPVIELLVSHCQYLENLRIWIRNPGGVSPPVDDLFIHGRWPKLRIFQISGVLVSPTHSMGVAMGSFFSFHREISYLGCYAHIYNDESPAHIKLPPDSLPQLSSLDAEDSMVKLILSCPCSPPRPVMQLLGLDLNRDFWEESSCNLQGVDRYALRAVRVTGIERVVDLRLLAESFPNIEYLDLCDIDVEAEVWDEDTVSTRTLLTAEWAEKLTSFRNLRALYGMSFLSSSELLEEENQVRVRWLAELFPRLETFDHGTYYKGAIEILRGADGPAWRIILNRPSPFSSSPD